MNEFLEQFLVESRELVEQGTRDLLELERAPADRESLDGAFRAFHTLKGGAAIVDFAAMSRAVHAAEDVLSAVRAGTAHVTPALVGSCLTCLDQVVQWLDTIQDSGALPEEADAQADKIVSCFEADGREGSSLDQLAVAVDVSSPLGDLPATILNEQILLVETRGEGLEGRIAAAGRAAANILTHLGRSSDAEQILDAAQRSRSAVDPSFLIDTIRNLLDHPGALIAKNENIQPIARHEPLSRTLRVDAGRIDALVNLTGELTVAKNALGHIAKSANENGATIAPELRREHAKLEHLVERLQRAVLYLRVLPLRNVFQRFPRVVRELSSSLEKTARLVTEGDDTEADRAIVEVLFEPLLHVVRNAMDHGIEASDERVATAKPAVATISLRAWRESDRVVIEVKDDGRGVDVARVREIAIARGLATRDDLASMDDADTIDLIFAPGFSTAREITSLSGRGVGLDVVRTTVERLGGKVSLQTEIGAGTVIRFVLPFSLMITRVMTVEAGGQMFGIPLDAVVETVRIGRENIRPIGASHAFILRNKTIPVVELCQSLGRPRGQVGPEALIVVALSGGHLGGFEVDRVGEQVDAMLTPPQGLLAGMPGVAGTTMLGNGAVLLVLDIEEVLH